MNMKNTRKGFTTVELVIVIAVIAILATVLIPTFSNMINQANLSVDTQNVRNMNVCLQTYITAGDPEDFGMVKERLKEFGYGKDDNFVARAKGHTFRWYAEKNVILLVDDKGTVVYPEEYADLPNVNDIRKCFDLSLPAAKVEKNTQTITVSGADMEGNHVADLPLAMSYTFTASQEESTNYSDWYADFFITFERDVEEVTLAGWYAAVEAQLGGWLIVSTPVVSDMEIGVIAMADPGRNWTYSDIQQVVSVFKCGVFDEVGGADKDAKMTVELRVTNPEDIDDIRVIGVFEYTFQ